MQELESFIWMGPVAGKRITRPVIVSDTANLGPICWRREDPVVGVRLEYALDIAKQTAILRVLEPKRRCKYVKRTRADE